MCAPTEAHASGKRESTHAHTRTPPPRSYRATSALGPPSYAAAERPHSAMEIAADPTPVRATKPSPRLVEGSLIWATGGTAKHVLDVCAEPVERRASRRRRAETIEGTLGNLIGVGAGDALCGGAPAVDVGRV